MKRKNFHRLCSLLIPLFMMVFGSQNAYAQKTVITGVVSDALDNTTIIGAAVIEKGTNNGVITDADGNFKINAKKGSTLVFSFLGYTDVEVVVGSQSKIDVQLELSTQYLEETIVVGYGTMRKREITGAVASLGGEDIKKIGGSNFADAMQGQIAGVNIQASNGAPGSLANVQIRGIGSLSAGSSGPLYVVDGLPYDGNPNITSSEIQSIEVLKDAASASIYGTRASNGVILITTKRGVEGRMSVDVDSYYGIQKITSGIPLMNTRDYLFTHIMKEELNGDGGGWIWTPLMSNPDGVNNNTNFMKELVNDNAPVQNHSINVSGGREGLTYNVVANYFSQEGVLIKANYDQMTLRSNTSYKKDRFSSFVTMGLNYSMRDNTPWGLHFNAIGLQPILPPPDYGMAENFAPVESAGSVGSLIGTLKQDNTTQQYGFNANIVLGYELYDGLTLKTSFGGNAGTSYQREFNPSYLIYDTNGNLHNASREFSNLTENYNLSYRWASETTLNYDGEIGDGHIIKAVAGFTLEQATGMNRQMKKEGFASESVTTPSAGTYGDLAAGNNSRNSLVGMLARVMYNYKDRYMASVSVRHDGSSRFGTDKWATFPSVSLGWNPSEETFYKNSSFSNILSDIKVRASYGTAGNQAIPNYVYDPKIYNQIDYVLGGGDQSNMWNGSTQRGFANPNVQWETSISRNIGLDLGFFKGALTLSADYYHTDKKNMLLPVAMSPSSGAPSGDWQFGNVYLNAGDLYNKGVEIALSYKGNVNDFTYGVSATFTKNKNMVTKTYVPSNFLKGGMPTRQARSTEDITYIKEGYPAGSFFLIPNAGTIKTDEQLAAYQEIVPTAKLGDLAMIDYDEDGDIDDDDRQYCGTGTPKFESGMNISLGYKNFDFSAHLYGSYGNMVYNGAKLNAYIWTRHQDLLNAWTPENPHSNIPTPRKELEHNNTRSLQAYYLEDGSYLRVKNLQLGYSFPDKWMNKAKIRSLRIYINAQNPFTFTRYTGYDPEIGGDGLFYKGVDEATYPVSSQYRFGVQFSF